jgi:sodium/potassium/calcium exchanger 6
MIILLTIAGAGWSGFTSTIGNSSFPIVVLFIILGVLSSIVLLVVDILVHYYLKPKGLHWSLQLVVAFLAFVTSIAWLNIEANEVVSILESFGLAFNIDTAILGLTVLAIGNSVGDWIADTAVARAGQPGMGVASCFGSPLLNDVLGLSFALIVSVGID